LDLSRSDRSRGPLGGAPVMHAEHFCARWRWLVKHRHITHGLTSNNG
jgi:hypothetical protein